MKEKIVGIVVCMLLLATVIPAVLSVKNSEINTTVLGYPMKSMGMNTPMKPGVELSNNEINTRDSNHPLASILGDWDWTEAQKITIPDGKKEYFGLDVAIDGDTAFIGAPGDDGWNGSVYVYSRSGTTWIQQQKLIPSDPGVNDLFGVRIALQGDTALIGADDENSQDNPGAVYVFTRTGTTWTEQQILTPPNGDPYDGFCWPALDGDTALIGAFGDDDMGVDAGAAYIFIRNGTIWMQQVKLFPADPAEGEQFGFSVALESDTALISIYDAWNDTVTPGAAYVFTRTGTTWTQQAKLVGSDTVPGDTFGIDVALDGNTAIVGAPNDSDQGDYSGSAFVFTRTGTSWTQEAKLLHSNGTLYDWLGCSVTLEGDTALIGAANEEEGAVEDRGAAYVFTRTGTTWTEQQRLISSDGRFRDYFGWPVNLDGDTAFIGAVVSAYGQGFNSGSVYVFTKTNLTFSTTGGIGIKASIRNNGIGNLTNLPWEIDVTGGIFGLINKMVNGTVNISAGKSSTVNTGMLFGFGPISITVKVADEENTAKGTQLLIFSIVKK